MPMYQHTTAFVVNMTHDNDGVYSLIATHQTQAEKTNPQKFVPLSKRIRMRHNNIITYIK